VRTRRGIFLLPALAILLVVALFVLTSTLLRAQDGDGARAEAPPEPVGVPADEPVARVASQVSPSVVQVNVTASQETPFGTQEGEGVGSGVIYREDGYIITNNHVVAGAREVSVLFADGSTQTAEVVGTDETTDLAVIRVDRNNLPAAAFVEEDLTVGQLAVAVGSPSGFQSTVSSGIVSGLNREVPSDYTGGQQESSLVDLIQTDAAISPGSSGGALADRAGRIIGINVAYLPPAETGAESIGFAIPSHTAVDVADSIIETGEAVHPYVGVSLADLSSETARQFGTESGALIAAVEGGTPAQQAGIEQGDVVVALEDEEIVDSGDLLSALRGYDPGERVTLTVVRDGQRNDLDVRLGERPV
jgi:S1-C subfamily serine protease